MPIKMIVKGGEVEKECEVKWTNGETYTVYTVTGLAAG